MKGIAEATGRSTQQIKNDMIEQGDLGEAIEQCLLISKLSQSLLQGAVAHSSRGKQKTLGFMKAPQPLTVRKVFARLKEIASMSGGKVCIICSRR